jgi:hypothetical protein
MKYPLVLEKTLARGGAGARRLFAAGLGVIKVHNTPFAFEKKRVSSCTDIGFMRLYEQK